MVSWNFNPSEYKARNFEPIPEGDYRVRINNVKEKVFSTGNEGFEITLDVPGQAGKLWYYLVLDPSNSLKTNQRLGMFFDSFAIRDTNLSNCSNWIGCDGAVRVKHSMYHGAITASVAFCLSRSQQKKFPDFLTGQQKKSSIDCTPYSNQQNKFTGFNAAPVAPREFPDGFQF